MQLNQSNQLYNSMYLSNSNSPSTPALCKALRTISCSAGGRMVSPFLRSKYAVRPKWTISMDMNFLYCSGNIFSWKLVNPLAYCTDLALRKNLQSAFKVQCCGFTIRRCSLSPIICEYATWRRHDAAIGQPACRHPENCSGKVVYVFFGIM